MSGLGHTDDSSRPTLPASFPRDFTGKWKGWIWANGKPVMEQPEHLDAFGGWGNQGITPEWRR